MKTTNWNSGKRHANLNPLKSINAFENKSGVEMLVIKDDNKQMSIILNVDEAEQIAQKLLDASDSLRDSIARDAAAMASELNTGSKPSPLVFGAFLKRLSGPVSEQLENLYNNNDITALTDELLLVQWRMLNSCRYYNRVNVLTPSEAEETIRALKDKYAIISSVIARVPEGQNSNNYPFALFWQRMIRRSQ